MIFLLFVVFPFVYAQLLPELLAGFQNGRFRGGPDGFNRGPGGFHRGPDGFGGDPRGGVDLGHLIGNIAANVGQEMGLNDADVIGDLRGISRGPRPSSMEWGRRARHFCRRYPGHPKCQRGQLPQFTDVPTIINTIIYNAGDLLPRVPTLNIHDPLAGLNSELVGFIKSLQSQFGQLSSQQRNEIHDSCRSFKCDQQSPQNTQAKQELLTKMLAFDQAVGGKAAPAHDKVNLRFDRTQQVKQALLKRANLSHIIVPADNGVFDRDVLLTEHQANFLLNELGEAGRGADVGAGGGGGGRVPRSGVFFQESAVQKWDIWKPIQYTLDDSLEESDKKDIRDALHEISINTCILFRYNATPKGYHLNYMKVDSTTFCGLSYVGRTDPANPIYLSFQCGDIDWSNIDPQHYDTFAISDAKLYTSYGTKYAYDSIMHYNAYLGAKDPNKPTMIPLVNPQENTPKLGQRAKLTRGDIRLLKKMYCRPGCDDQNVHCGTWALHGYCKMKEQMKWMNENCKASCDKC
ncbi:Zinc metalloproteinase nas-9 [Caenorhabditis elegans]|uniref:Isoform a of Zinc metalloproteinase nas-9 n=1 Tax=Caenorhabditis elegans TaxID=6239 RepID=P91137-2|nr:Zinc metalloproteinase nas-9 [Caenorhabditis elegans]CCD66988.1 Zinc metalloproteinase nas-9 [Caenorhabditis elegans]|eukprot:NP_741531.1 Zinc metalloproteinase nas-9 [Caenorhabditis elegans]